MVFFFFFFFTFFILSTSIHRLDTGVATNICRNYGKSVRYCENSYCIFIRHLISALRDKTP